MSVSVETTAEPDVENLIAQITEAFSSGGTLGNLVGYDDQDYEAVYVLGHSFYSQARYMDALKAFAFLVMNNPIEKRFANAYASSLQMLKRYEDAIAFYSLGSIMDIADPRPTFHTAECLIALSRIEEGAEALNIVISQCKSAEQDPLKERATALLDLLTSHKSE